MFLFDETLTNYERSKEEHEYRIIKKLETLVIKPSILKGLTAAEKEKAEVAPADREYNRVQKELESKREPVDEIIREISDTIQFIKRKDSASSVRRLMRNYGFTYRYLKDEQVEEEVVKNENEQL